MKVVNDKSSSLSMKNNDGVYGKWLPPSFCCRSHLVRNVLAEQACLVAHSVEQERQLLWSSQREHAGRALHQVPVHVLDEAAVANVDDGGARDVGDEFVQFGTRPAVSDDDRVDGHRVPGGGEDCGQSIVAVPEGQLGHAAEVVLDDGFQVRDGLLGGDGPESLEVAHLVGELAALLQLLDGFDIVNRTAAQEVLGPLVEDD